MAIAGSLAFLSHSSRDKENVLRLANDLKRKGLRVWLDEWVKPNK
jgi:hypothetical protein